MSGRDTRVSPGSRRDVVAKACRHGDCGERLERQARCEPHEVRDDLLEDALVEFHQIDLVDRQNDVRDAEQRADRGVTACLHDDALARIDQDDGEFRIRCPGRHVAGELLMPRRVGDDERALSGREIAITDIDRDLLLAFGLETVEQQGEVDRLPGRSECLRILFERAQLIGEDTPGVIEQAADQRGLAVVDRTAGQKPQQVLLADPADLCICALRGSGHQK